MSRNLLILALLVSGTGCSATRPLLSTIVVTPPKLLFRPLPPGDSWQWTAVAVTYPSEALIPPPCAPTLVPAIELVSLFEEDERPAPWSPSGPVPAVEADALVPTVSAPSPARSDIVQFEEATSPQAINQSVPSVATVTFEITPVIQNAVAVTYPSGSLIPAPCAPSPVRPIELVAFFEEDECPAPRSPSGPAPAVTMVFPVPPVDAPFPAPPTFVHHNNATSPQAVNLPVPSVAPVRSGSTPIIQTASISTLPAPPVRVESPSPTESHWKPTTSIALVSPVQTRTAMRCNQDETSLSEVRQVVPVEYLSSPVLVQSDLAELLTEIRNQRQLIEALQRELTRERSADDAAIEELEAVVENLVVQTKIAQADMPTTIRK